MNRTRLYVVRHAEFDASLGHSARGSHQASALAQHLSRRDLGSFSRIVSSPLCLETAQIIKAAVMGVDGIDVDDRLKPWDGGVITGLSKDEIKRKMPRLYQRRFLERSASYKVPEGESLQERHDRVKEFVNHVLKHDFNKQLIVVTHGGVIDDLFRIVSVMNPTQLTNLTKEYGCLSVLTCMKDSFGNLKWHGEWASSEHLPVVVAESPSGGALFAFPAQVSGSMPLLIGDRGVVCKPASARELSVYRKIFAPNDAHVSELRRVVPKFEGTLAIDVSHLLSSNGDTELWKSFTEERVRRKLILEDDAEACEDFPKVVYLVLENAEHTMKPPVAVLDLKLGTRQHANDDPPDKVARKQRKCAKSTSRKLGVRVGGMRRLRGVPRNKKWGMALSAEEFSSELVHFFEEAPSREARLALKNGVQEVYQALSKTQWRFFGSSLLLAYDANGRTSVRLIDFAHADVNRKGGIDKGSMLGLVTVLNACSVAENAAK